MSPWPGAPYKWQRMIDSGEVPGVAVIASEHKVDRAYVSRILSLAMLAPDIVQATIEGREPGGMSLRKLAKTPPSRWDRQRHTLCF